MDSIHLCPVHGYPGLQIIIGATKCGGDGDVMIRNSAINEDLIQEYKAMICGRRVITHAYYQCDCSLRHHQNFEEKGGEIFILKMGV